VALLLVLAVSLPFMGLELHAASPSANKPAKSTAGSLRFMINSFCWVFFRVCVTMPRATLVRGAKPRDVQADRKGHEPDQTKGGRRGT
jgi:hypothetical protein